MKTKLFPVFNICFVIAAVLLFVCAVVLPPARSIADQGDFERVMRQCGLDFPTVYSFFDYACRFYEMKFTSADMWLLLPRLLLIAPATAFIFPITLARIICLPFGTFDVRVLAVIMFLWYTSVCLFIIRFIKINSTLLKLLFVSAFLFVFYNGINLTFFNSMYGQSVMLTSFATLILAALYLFEDVYHAKIKHIIFFALASCLMISSKLQCFVFTPFLAFLILYAALKSKHKATGIICAVLMLWNGIGGYAVNSINLNTDTQYNSVFYGILKDSQTPQEDLKFLGLDTDLALDAGKHAYLDSSEYVFPPRSRAAEQKFNSKMTNSKLIKFYLAHPSRFVSAMEDTAKNAFTNKISLGTFYVSEGKSAGECSYRMELWENVRSHLPKTLWSIIPVFLLFAVFVFIVFKKKNKYAIPLLTVLLMGVIQFPMPYIGNGAADISKQLFMFNTVFDFFCIILLYSIIIRIDKKIKSV